MMAYTIVWTDKDGNENKSWYSLGVSFQEVKADAELISVTEDAIVHIENENKTIVCTIFPKWARRRMGA